MSDRYIPGPVLRVTVEKFKLIDKAACFGSLREIRITPVPFRDDIYLAGPVDTDSRIIPSKTPGMFRGIEFRHLGRKPRFHLLMSKTREQMIWEQKASAGFPG